MKGLQHRPLEAGIVFDLLAYCCEWRGTLGLGDRMRTYIPESNVSFVEANGLRFGFLAEGDGPLVLLMHGFPDTPHTWDHVRPALAAAGFRAVSPFMRGYAPKRTRRLGVEPG
jgi:hypothetical protein